MEGYHPGITPPNQAPYPPGNKPGCGACDPWVNYSAISGRASVNMGGKY